MRYILIALFPIIICSCNNQKIDESKTETQYCLPETFKASIEIMELSEQAISEGIHLMGSVETNPDKVLEYVSLVRGVVSNVYFSLGDEVKKGQVLAELRSAELSALQSQVSSIDAQIQTAERNLQAVESLHLDKLASDRDLSEARSQLKMLRSEKQRSLSDLSLYGANMGKGVFQIKAPASGIITSKSINPGMHISDESGILFTIASLDNVWIMANVYATNLQSIKPKMKVEISTLSYPNEIFKGRISVLSPIMDQNEKVLKARIVLDNPDLKLKAGMVVDVNAIKESDDKAIAIPASAVVFSDNENFVLVYKNDCSIEIRKVQFIAQNDATYFVKDGLTPGENIITKNPLVIFEQLKNFEN